MKTTIDIDDNLIPDGWELVRIGKPVPGEKMLVVSAGDVTVDDSALWLCHKSSFIVREKPKSLVVEAGKRYVTRGGDVSGPMHSGLRRIDYCWVDDTTGASYTNAGKYDLGEESPLDLVSEYVEPEPKYRPFANASEFTPHRDMFVLTYGFPKRRRVLEFDDQGVTLLHANNTYASMLQNAKFENGSPFGVKE